VQYSNHSAHLLDTSAGNRAKDLQTAQNIVMFCFELTVGNVMSGSRGKCIVCGSGLGPDRITSKEMIFGTGEEFTYLQCEVCRSVQLEIIPDSLDRYYPEQYPAFRWNSFVVDRLGELVFYHGLIDRSVARTTGMSISAAIQTGAIQAFRLIPRIRWLMGVLEPRPDLKVLDVGCGSGIHLRILRLLGYRNLTGIDPFLREPLRRAGLSLIRGSVHDMKGSYDLVLLNHSLEHMSDPKEVLEQVSRLLSDNGICVVRIPVVPSYAWEKYRGSWSQLDPPRHIYVPSVDGLKRLASECGLDVVSTEFVSDDFQFWGSEQIVRGIHLLDEKSYSKNRRASGFTRSQIREFRAMSARLNAESRGDEVVIRMRRAR